MSSIINGKYYPDDAKKQPAEMNSQFKAWNFDTQRRIHARDIIQMYKNGNPNPDFIREYPEESSKVFTESQIRQYGNEY